MEDAAPIRLDAEARAWIESCARAAGFDLAGVAAVADRGSQDSTRDAARLQEWIAEGRNGEMAWLARVDEHGELLRSHPSVALPWAQSVLVCAVNYTARAERSVDPAPRGAGWIARYAWSGAHDATTPEATPPDALRGSDYHDVLLDKLRAVEAQIQARFGERLLTRCYVDTGPLVERSLAARAGIGWIGKNTCVLNQQQGSWLLLGVVVLSAELAREATVTFAADRCGSCTRCIDACPTDALIAPRRMDASLCIAYLTIEKKGSVAEPLRAKIGRQVFGCDICQDVCPWNRRAPLATAAAMPVRDELINLDLAMLGALDGPGFKTMFRGSPLERTGRKRLLRNVAIAMGNSGEQRFEAQLRAWAGGDDAVLAETAAWALRHLEAS